MIIGQKKYNSISLFQKPLFIIVIYAPSSFMALKNMMLLLSLLFVLHSLLTPTCYCQSNSPQNIETFYPNETPEQAPRTQSPGPPIKPQASPPASPVAASKSSSSNSKVAKAVAATAASTLVVSGIVFFLVLRCFRARRKKEVTNTASAADTRPVVPPVSVFERIDGNIKGLIVDEDGLDVIYWKRLQEGKNTDKDFKKEVLSSPEIKQEDDHEGYQRKKPESIQEAPLLRGLSSTSHLNIFPEEPYTIMRIPPPAPPPILPASGGADINSVQKLDFPTQPFAPPSPHSTPKPPSTSLSSITKVTSAAPPQQQQLSFLPLVEVGYIDQTTSNNLPPSIPDKKSLALAPPAPSTIPDRKSVAPAPPPPPTILGRKSSAPAPPPPPPIPDKKSQTPTPPPPPIPARKSPTPPPPPPKAGNLKSSSKPPPTPAETPGKKGKSSVEEMPETGNGQVKLKPLHWDKVNTNLDHSMVWDKIDRGSLRVDHELMEALFGFVPINRDTPKANNSASPSRDASAPSTKATLLDPRKSQNTAIVLKSLAISRKEVIDALLDGQGLNTDTIEKLARVAPTEEEQSLILEYKGDPSKLPAAESFLFHILKAVPSAFTRLNAMLFRLNYDTEILEIKEFLQTLELGCKELRNQGVFLKLLEAVLKAGNRMNAGTHRGNAQAFNLASLRKLSDVKSTDGKTTLLHFVVEEVVRSEGKRAVLNRNYSMSRSSSRSSSSRSSDTSENSENSAVSDEQRQREYITLGLPIVGGISSEFSNANKAALIDYNSFVGSISALSARIVEIQGAVSQCGDDEGGNFAREMNHFLASAEEELRLVREDQTRVMQLVKRTTEYYQGGAWKDGGEHPLHLFVIVKDFLGKVDQACIEIARNMQKRKAPKGY